MENLGIEVELIKDFNVIREILERIGISNKREKILYPSCYILSKKGKYYIVHFKELFKLDGRNSTLDAKDIRRRDSIAFLLSKWGLVNPVNKTVDELKSNEYFHILPKDEKDSGEWTISHKYSIGKQKSKNKGE